MRKAAGTIAIAIAILLAVACGGDTLPAEVADQTAPPREPEPAAQAGPTPTRTTPIPESQLTRATEESQATPTAEPARVETPTVEPAGEETGGENGGATETPEQQASETMTPQDALRSIPPDPRTTDEFVLQESFYAGMDLKQYELDPEEPLDSSLPSDSYSPHFFHPMSKMDPDRLQKNRFLHLFPHLHSLVELESDNLRRGYYVTMLNDKLDVNDQTFFAHGWGDISADRGGITYFINYPWFEPVHLNEITFLGEAYAYFGSRPRNRWIDQTTDWHSNEKQPWPPWFGDDSLRGVLLETVAGLIEQATVPEAEPMPRGWWGEGVPYRHYTDDRQEKDPPPVRRDWSISEFISTGYTPETKSFHPGSPDKSPETGAALTDMRGHRTPEVTWELVDDLLPIVRVNVFSEQALPLRIPGVPESEEPIRYTVSFVVSFQNRWQSFSDPDRWMNRFRADLEKYKGAPWTPDPAIDDKYPNYWDDTDYMHHRIIGPVVMTVHPARNRESYVLKPGNYSALPRIDHWPAPGHVLTPAQVPLASEEEVGGELGPRSWGASGVSVLRQWPIYQDPSPGFPLPGHVLVFPGVGPGTDVWEAMGMDEKDGGW